jgi:hypothetical protein
MTFRPITEAQARAVLKILVEECGHRVFDSQRDGDAFVHAIKVADDPHPFNICREYRFMGELGFGGKFRNNGNHENTPHVDCYREDETPARLAMIERANKRLAELFGGDR